MAKIRKTTRVNVQYTMVHNSCFRGLLGAVEVAILGHGLSHQDGWEFEREELDTVFADVGKTRLEKALQGLRRKGFIEITKYREDDGTYQWEWDFTPDPNHAAERAEANPEGKIIDLSKPQVTPPPGNGVLDSPAQTQETAGRTTPLKPEAGQPGDGERGSGQQGDGLYKEEKNTQEDQSPPTPRNTVAEVAPFPVRGGEDLTESKPQPAVADAVELVRSAVSIHEMGLISRHRRRGELAKAVAGLLASGCPHRSIVEVLSRDRAGLGDVVGGLIGRLRALEPASDANPDNDAFAPQAANEAPSRPVPPHCGRCSGGHHNNPKRYRRVIMGDNGILGDMCACHPEHPANLIKETV